MTETLNVKTILLSLLMLLLPPGELFLFYFMKDTDTGSFLTGFITLGMLLLVFAFVFLTGLYKKSFYTITVHIRKDFWVYMCWGFCLWQSTRFCRASSGCFCPLAVMLMLASRVADRDRRLSDPVISAGADQSARSGCICQLCTDRYDGDGFIQSSGYDLFIWCAPIYSASVYLSGTSLHGFCTAGYDHF